VKQGEDPKEVLKAAVGNIFDGKAMSKDDRDFGQIFDEAYALYTGERYKDEEAKRARATILVKPDKSGFYKPKNGGGKRKKRTRRKRKRKRKRTRKIRKYKKRTGKKIICISIPNKKDTRKLIKVTKKRAKKTRCK
jgi:hypothetical protein